MTLPGPPRSVLIRALVAFACVMFPTKDSIGQSERLTPTREHVERELKRALERVEARYSSVTISGILTEERYFKPANEKKGPEGKGKGTATVAPAGADTRLKTIISRKVVLQANDRLFKSDTELISVKEYDAESDSLRDTSIPSPSRLVACIGRDCFFELRWDGGHPIVAAFEGSDKGEASNPAKVRNWEWDFLRAPCVYWSGTATLAEMMSYPSFSIDKIDTVREGDHEHLLADFEFDLADDKKRVIPERIKSQLAARGLKPSMKGMVRGWFQVSPDEDWSIYAFGVGSHSQKPFRGARRRIEYNRSRDGAMLPHRIILDQPPVSKRTTLQIESIDFATVPEREFTLSAYGLPELGQPTRPMSAIRPGTLAIGGAVVALLAAIALKYSAWRFRNRQDNS